MLSKEVMEKNARLFEELVPEEGAAESKAGELLRAVNRIGYRYWNDGDMLFVDYGNETCNPAMRYIMLEVDEDSEVFKIANEIWDAGGVDESEYGPAIDRLVEAVVNYVDSHPELRGEDREYAFEELQENEDFWWNKDYWKEEEEEEWREPFAVYDPEPRW